MQTTLRGPIVGTETGRVAEEALRSCVHCGFCNATCPTYRLTGDELDGPRGRIYLMKQALEGEPVSQISLTHLDRCLSCRACETTCPSGVQYHRLYDIGHAMVAEAAPRSWAGALARRAIRLVSTTGLFGAALRVGRTIRPLLPPRLRSKVTEKVEPGSWPNRIQPRKAVMLGGCVQAAAAPHFNAAAARVLDVAGVETREVGGCCGAVHFHLDAPEAARRAARRNLDAWRPHLEAGAEAVIVTSSGCAAFIKDYPDVLRDDPDYVDVARTAASRVRDPVELLEGANLPVRRAPEKAHIVVHEPCTLQHGLRLSGAVAQILRDLGYEPQPVEDAHICCGSAGAYALLQPRFAEALKQSKLAALNAAGPQVIYTANIGCWMHLKNGSPAPVRHWIEAVDDVTRP